MAALTRSLAGCLTGNSKQRVRRLQIATVQVWGYALHRVSDEEALEMLEPNALKGASPVLRGGGGGNTVSLPGLRHEVVSIFVM